VEESGVRRQVVAIPRLYVTSDGTRPCQKKDQNTAGHHVLTTIVRRQIKPARRYLSVQRNRKFHLLVFIRNHKVCVDVRVVCISPFHISKLTGDTFAPACCCWGGEGLRGLRRTDEEVRRTHCTFYIK
jgi:hypothetical protein